jgi:hypothetical protein
MYSRESPYNDDFLEFLPLGILSKGWVSRCQMSVSRSVARHGPNRDVPCLAGESCVCVCVCVCLYHCNARTLLSLFPPPPSPFLSHSPPVPFPRRRHCPPPLPASQTQRRLLLLLLQLQLLLLLHLRALRQHPGTPIIFICLFLFILPPGDSPLSTLGGLVPNPRIYRVHTRIKYLIYANILPPGDSPLSMLCIRGDSKPPNLCVSPHPPPRISPSSNFGPLPTFSSEAPLLLWRPCT